MARLLLQRPSMVRKWPTAGLLLAFLACASAPARKADAPAKPKRELDTAPERRAALPGADRESQPENVEARFNREAASERKDAQQTPAPQKTKTEVVEGNKTPKP